MQNKIKAKITVIWLFYQSYILSSLLAPLLGGKQYICHDITVIALTVAVDAVGISTVFQVLIS